jgi:putative Holliday junction resolvase
VLALDLGERRIGVAATDPSGVLAQPLTVIQRTSRPEEIARIAEIAAARGAKRIVIGLPLNMNGSVGPQARASRRFAGAVRKSTNLEVELWDERLTTASAEQVLIAADQSRARRRELRDAMAAALILESYLESHRGKDDE